MVFLVCGGGPSGGRPAGQQEGAGTGYDAVVRPPTRSATPRSTGARVAGRYLIEAELARGGMGTVYAVLDESTGRRVALKRLGGGRAGGTTRRKGTGSTDVELLFRLEYTMLARLRHPRIIEVYEYGVDRRVPYYTMELLDGQDLRELAKVPYRDACRHVRDVASSLALLHAHRLVHRDVSPRNVRLTAEGRCKLFDFGTLTPFGVPADIAGTPSCVPPEALNGSPLDHRADLYSLGCVLYWLLSAREAFPAGCLDELPGLLEGIPASPSVWSPDVPPELDAMVLSMVSRDPLARPSSAAEVIERLDAIGRLEPEERREVAYSYVLSAKTVGRTDELQAIGHGIERALSANGGGVLVEGERGFGKSRLAHEAALSAQVRGATVLVVDAGLCAGPNATARALGNRLLLASPLEAGGTALPYAPHLCHIVPELASRLGSTEVARPPSAPGEWRLRLHAALKAWFLDFAERRPLVLVVDDLDRADEASLGFLSALVSAAQGRRLLVVATASPRAPALAAFSAFGTRLVLGPLAPDSLSELASSLFGDAAETRRLALRLHEQSGGSPAHCMELVRHLVGARFVRYEGGVWMLPDDTWVEGLPRTAEGLVAARLAGLPTETRALAEALSVASTALPLGLCLGLAKQDVKTAERSAIALLDELVSEGILVGSGGRYRFSDGALREALLSGLEGARRAGLHRTVGEALLREGGTFDSIIAGWHLLQGGDEERGAELLADSGRRLILETDDLHAAVPALESALAVYRARGRPAHEQALLVGPLAAASFFVDRRLAARYGREALSLLCQATGLTRAADLRRTTGARAALGIAVATAAMERRLAGGEPSSVSTRDLLELLLRCAMTLSGVATVCLDADAVRHVTTMLEPISGLGEGHAATWVCRYGTSLLALCEGRLEEARAGLVLVLSDLESSARRTAFPEHARRLFVGGALYALGALESLRDGGDVLAYADRLDSLDLRLYDMVAEQLRMLHHAHRGESELARRHRDRVESHAIARGSAWQVDVWEPPMMLLVHLRESNVVGLKLTAERLERLSHDIPSLSRFGSVAKGAHLWLRGELDEAAEVLEEVQRSSEEAPFLGIGIAIGVLAGVYNARGEHARAAAITSGFLEGLTPGERSLVRLFLLARREHAYALAGMGDVSRAEREIEQAIAEQAPFGDPVSLGLLHQTAARLALSHGDRRRFAVHHDAMQLRFRPTGNPALISMCEQLQHEARRATGISQVHQRVAPELAVPTSRRTSGA
jgi:hypothetical protein